MTRRRRPTIAAAIYDGLGSFEYSIAREVLGLDRRDLVPGWYDFVPCRVEDGELRSSHGLAIEPSAGFEGLSRAETILIASWRDPLERPGQEWIDALRGAHRRGARLVTICTGAFVLAHAGLLDGRRATTHWLHGETLRRLFPQIRCEDDALYRCDADGPGEIWTSAGCAAGLDLCLALVREDFGLQVANAIARRMVAPAHREGGQSQYAEAPVGVAEDERFGRILDWLGERLDQPLAVEMVARRFGFSLRTFQRRFREVTGQSPHQWLVQQRVGRARELLESSDQSVEQIATDSGFGTAANLRKHLARHLGTTPRAYRSAFRAG